jgi:hypothetical protein
MAMQLTRTDASVTDRANGLSGSESKSERVDVYFSADVETDGPIPGPYSMLSMALVYAGRFDGSHFQRPENFECSFYRELRPISGDFQPEALRVNGLDRARLVRDGTSPEVAMSEAARWIHEVADGGEPVLVAYPLSFDWSWLYWYFMRFAPAGSPFNHSRVFDIKTAFAVKAGLPVSLAGRSNLAPELRAHGSHTHHALDDAKEQAEIFGNLFEWRGPIVRPTTGSLR